MNEQRHSVDDGVVIRRAVGDDLEPIVAFGRGAMPSTYEGILGPEVTGLLVAKQWTTDAMVPAIRAGRAFVACDGDTVIGMSSYGHHEGGLAVWKLYVEPTYHGRGVGGRLLQQILDRGADVGLPVRICFTDGNRNAPDFCARHGFVEIARESQAGLPDLVWMGRPGDVMLVTPAVPEDPRDPDDPDAPQPREANA